MKVEVEELELLLGESEFLLASRARVLGTQEEESRKKAQEVDCEVSQSWTAVYQSIARRMLSDLDKSEA